MSWYNEAIIPINPYSRPGRIRSFTRNFVWHYTANPGASARNHATYFGKTMIEQNEAIVAEAASTGDASLLKQIRYASANIFIDPIEILVIIPIEEESWHASQANPYSVGIELCIEADGTFHPKTIANAIKCAVELNKLYDGVKISDYLRHYDVTGKVCPKPWVDLPSGPIEWAKFKTQVEDAMKGRVNRVPVWTQEMWAEFAKGLTETMGDYAWAEKAYSGRLTVDEVMYLQGIMLMRSLGAKV